MQRSLCAGFALLIAGCGGGAQGGGASVTPVTSSAQAIRSFMQAAADSNLSRMAELWGTPDGPAAQTGRPEGWEKRIAVIQAYLKNDSTRLVSDMPVTGETNQRRALVNVWRMGCSRQVPAVLARTKAGGWVVTTVDLTAAGNPARPCENP